MGYLRKVLVASVGAVSLIGAGTLSAGARDRGTLIEFDAMTPVTGSAVGTVNHRGITGGEGSVTLPHPCKDPIVFVTSSGGAWFAKSKSDEAGD
jgi:hypothetical protein